MVKDLSEISDRTPILVGVGQIKEEVPENLEKASSHIDITSKAALVALNDAKDQNLSKHIDVIAAVRTFSDSSPVYRSSFGSSNNFPRSIAKRIGASPTYAIYDALGGQSPQKLVGEMAEGLSDGSYEMALICGGEVIANMKAAKKQKITLDWKEEITGQLEDRGFGKVKMGTTAAFMHQMMLPMQFYGMMENARRFKLKMDQKSYNKLMGDCFSKFTKVSAKNPFAVDQKIYDSEILTNPTGKNKIFVSPYTKNLIAKDKVNQSAAILMTTVGKAKELKIDSGKWVFLHGYADLAEKTILERTDLGSSIAMKESILGALDKANKLPSSIRFLDIYSCFPIVVLEAKTILDIGDDDLRSLTVTGGLPYFGGPGNNYSTHAIVSIVELLRVNPNDYGLVYANGGFMTKHSTGIYSCQPPIEKWKPSDSSTMQEVVDRQDSYKVVLRPNGEALIDSYIIHYFNDYPMKAIIAGRLKNVKERFYATIPLEDSKMLQKLNNEDCLGQTIFVEEDPKGNRFAFSKEDLATFRPKIINKIKEKYKFCVVEKNGEILKVSINRPERRNALHPMANEEMEGIFNAFEKDESLRVAILTGEGDNSFSAGNDIKYMAEGNPVWVPKSGFAGVTHRTKRTKPIIAAINGSALGGGLEIALACDIIVAAEHATFGLPEVKIGLIAAAGGIQRLTRSIGKKAAMELILTGRSINSQKALNFGIINYVVPKEQLLIKAQEIAEKICEASPVAIKASMKLLNESEYFSSQDEAINHPYDIMDDIFNSEDFFEGAYAFAEKRKPKWVKN